MKLDKVKRIQGQIQVMTGLHIGASSEAIEIGGLDNPIIKDPINQAPYIPGSSLKGKMRSLAEIREGRHAKNGNPCDCGKKDCSICPVFGTSANKRPEDLGPTRIVVRDAHLSGKNGNGRSWAGKFAEGDLPLEIKYENAINRITGVANPRPLERVPAGVEFDFNIAFKVFEGDPADYFNTLLKAMRLLELDALGGAGSRGCGQVRFVNVKIDDEAQEPDFLEKIAV